MVRALSSKSAVIEASLTRNVHLLVVAMRGVATVQSAAGAPARSVEGHVPDPMGSARVTPRVIATSEGRGSSDVGRPRPPGGRHRRARGDWFRGALLHRRAVGPCR